MTIYTADIVKQDILTFPASTDTWNVVTFYVNTSYLTLSCTSELPFVIGSYNPGFEFNKAEMYFSPDGASNPPADRAASLHVEMMQDPTILFPGRNKTIVDRLLVVPLGPINLHCGPL